MYKTRIAPTCSGYLHLGNVLSFALTAALAARTGARILLRIDDLDHQRAALPYIQDIFDTLDFLELPWHEGPRSVTELQNEWSQMHRMELYGQALQQLQHNGHVFACTCSRSQIRSISADESYPGTCCNKHVPLDTPHVNWRLHTPRQAAVTINTWPAGIAQATLPAAMQHFAVRKKDGFPAYQLSSVIDDVHFGITHVVRGADLWASTIAQHYLAGVLQAHDFLQVKFYHHALLTDAQNQKLSKTAGAASVRYMRQQGYTAAMVYQAIANLLNIKSPASNWQQLAGAVWRQETL